MSTQRVIVLGGTSGIGLATAEQLLAHGKQVVIAGRRSERLSELSSSLSGEVSLMRLDATDRAATAAFFAEVGPFHHLVIALGGNRGMGALNELDLDEVRAQFEAKFWPHINAAQAALSTLDPTGSITFISAASAGAALPGTVGLATANAAIEAMVPVLAVELRPLRVNAVSPGVTVTGWWDFLPETQRAATLDQFTASIPLARPARPEEIAEAVSFLVETTYVTGQVLRCDGGAQLVA